MTNSINDDPGRAVAHPPPLVSDYGLVMTVYILYLLGFLTGITALAGVIIAHVKAGRSDPISDSHFRFQIRTFWIGLLYIVVGAIAYLVWIGPLIWLWWVIWTLIRSIKGLLALNEREPIGNPQSWLFG